MKLTSIRRCGRYKHRESGQTVNIHGGKKPGRSQTYYFYLRSGVRVFIAEADFREQWDRVPVNV